MVLMLSVLHLRRLDAGEVDARGTATRGSPPSLGDALGSALGLRWRHGCEEHPGGGEGVHHGIGDDVQHVVEQVVQQVVHEAVHQGSHQGTDHGHRQDKGQDKGRDERQDDG